MATDLVEKFFTSMLMNFIRVISHYFVMYIVLQLCYILYNRVTSMFYIF